ncbi:YciI family protein [Actinopolymorpha pittospori]|uniref:YCII-related domain-containing protein n=1 Tax=Actinopolymorpha pittospori TaxID=648752 RepID=A0A927MNP2_9ACTN|nr:hypothetical protein [Actinopolymorpha pittospori]MBE1603879.1 hypothetical protein [Actinopolymorpha pittospori]
MQYLVCVIDDKGNPGSTDTQPAISAFNERLIAEGYWVFAGGLADTTAATVIDNRGEQAVFSDGPFVESKEYPNSASRPMSATTSTPSPATA